MAEVLYVRIRADLLGGEIQYESVAEQSSAWCVCIHEGESEIAGKERERADREIKTHISLLEKR